MDKVVNKGHLSSKERDKISIFHSQGYSIRQIAKELKRSPSTISRELKRTEAVFFRGKYIGSQTHGNVKRNWKQSHLKKRIIDTNLKLKKYIFECLKLGLSPQLIAGRLNTKYGFKIHHETIYQYIYKQRTDLAQYLLRRKYGRKPRRVKKYKPMKSLIPNRVDIDFRSIEAKARAEFGHFEADSVESCRIRGAQLPCLTVIVDRATRKTSIKKTVSKTSIETNISITKALKQYNLKLIKSITYDNGMEFSKHEKINKKLKAQSYFCKPYHSWEKGTVENINGLIRRFFPKGTNFDTIKNKDIKKVENWINNRPMKVLGFKTPNEKFKELMLAS